MQNFYLSEGADEATIEKYTKAYLLYLIGVVLFSDKTGNRVQLLYLTLLDAPWEVISGYSWGSAALGYLYRRLCGASRKNGKETAGPLIILQVILTLHVIDLFLNLFLCFVYLLVSVIHSFGRGSTFSFGNR